MYWSARTYSHFTIKAAIGSVSQYVDRAVELGHPALAITDRNFLSGGYDLYKAARQHGLNPVPGIELWVTADGSPPHRLQGTLTFLATSTTGLRNITALTRIAFRDNVHGHLDLANLASAAETGGLDGVACLTGPISSGFIHSMLRTSSNPHTVKNILTSLQQWCGSGVWTEIPIVTSPDDAVSQQQSLLYALATSLGLPVIATSGPRYVHKHDRHAWLTLNTINQDTHLHVDPTCTTHLLSNNEASMHMDPNLWKECIAGLDTLNSLCHVTIPEVDTFTTSVPNVSFPKDPDADLMDRVNYGLVQRINAGQLHPPLKEADYWARLNEELEVVYTAGFSGYLLFTATVTDWMRKEQILYRIRGSASASLLCWVLGITSIDPLAWDLRFDRFLAQDRTKPPDIDIDVPPMRRNDIVEWLENTFPTMRICTWSAGRATVSEDTDLKGSLVIQLRAALNRSTGDAHAILSDKEESQLAELARHEPYLSVGVNAAGVLVTPDEATMNRLPIYRVDSSNTLVVGLDKDTVESLGYVKLDVLGVKTLDALHKILHTLGMTLDDIPPSDDDVIKYLSSGKTGGIFQLDGKSFQTGIKRLKPRQFTDLVDAMALFRPATMQSGETTRYINRKFRKEPIPVRHPLINSHVSATYGVLLYQEQAIGLLRDLGLTAAEIEQARAAIKASNNAVKGARTSMNAVLTKAVSFGKEQGMSSDDLAWLDSALRAYAEYGFNKAHAVSYAEVAYWSAWCKYHFPLEFWSAFLTVYTGTPKEKTYLTEMRDSGITIRGPHVNKSGADYRIDRDGQSIRKSLTSIKHVGHDAANQIAHNAPYASLDDLINLLPASLITGLNKLAEGKSPQSCGGVIAALDKAGALTGLTRKEPHVL